MTFDRQAKYAFIIACATLAVCAVGFKAAVAQFGIYIRKQPVELRSLFDNIPTTLGEWEKVGESRRLSTEMVEELGTPFYLNRNYRKEGENDWSPVQLHLAYYTGMVDAVPHIPERCNVAGGMVAQSQPRTYALDIDRSDWSTDELLNIDRNEPYQTATRRNPITGRTETIRMPLGDLELRVTEFTIPDQPDLRIRAGYFFIANGGATSSPEGVKALAFRLQERYAYYCKVQLTMAGGPEFTAEEYISACSDLLEELLPELMRCLPDWSEVERREQPAS